MSRIASIAILLLVPAASATAQTGGLILNEYNAVGSTKWLGNPDTAACNGPAGLTCAENEDVYLGRVLGNGGNWIELVVTVDHLDIRGWQLRWAERGNTTANGTNLWYGPGNIEQGIITFSQHEVWSDLRAGTILTIHEFGSSQPQGVLEGGRDNDFTFDPCAGDWWIAAHTFQNAAYVTSVTNVVGDGPGNFSVGNGEWLVEVRNAAGGLVTPACGEGATGYGGGGVNSREVVRLEVDPSAAVNNASLYDDGDSSSLGQPNSWGNALTGCREFQDFTAVRAAALAECPRCVPVILNEYNAVESDKFLGGGDAKADENGGFASDAHFGRIVGNGGDWFELVVIEDGLDLRGWRLDWSRGRGEASGSILLSGSEALNGIPAGTILTFIERTSAEGGMDTVLDGTHAGGGRWMNINTFDTSLVVGTTSTSPKHVSGRFNTSNNRWALTVRDAAGEAVFGPAGEGGPYYFMGGVSSTDVCRLREDPGVRIAADARYDDTGRASTFGAPNHVSTCPDDGVGFEQDFTGLPAEGCSAPPSGPAEDLNGDGQVNAADLAIQLGNWGGSGIGDLDGDGAVTAADLARLLSAWG